MDNKNYGIVEIYENSSKKNEKVYLSFEEKINELMMDLTERVQNLKI